MQKETKQEWIDILENLPEESEVLDYKVKFYDLQVAGKKNKDAVIDFAIDVNALMNSPREEKAYLIIGVSNDREIKGIDQDVNESYAKKCLYDCINANSNISVNNFTYKNTRLCIIEIDLPSSGIPAYFISDYNKNGRFIKRNTYYSRRGKSNTSVNEMTNQERNTLTEWLEKNKKQNQEINSFIDGLFVLHTKSESEIIDSVLDKFELNKDDAITIIEKRRAEIKSYGREAKYPSSIADNSEFNNQLLKKHGISEELQYALEQNYYASQYVHKSDEWGCGKIILFIVGIPILLFVFYVFYNQWLEKQEIDECAKPSCSSLKPQVSYYEFQKDYIKSKCDCEKLLLISLNKYIDSLLLKGNYQEARLLIINEREKLDNKEFNYKLKVSLEKDSTLTEEQKEEVMNMFKSNPPY